MKGKTMLKVSSILMLIGGILSAILGVVALIGIAALAALGASSGLLTVSGVLVLVGAIVEIIASAKGLGACKAPEKAKGCMPWGIIVAVLCIVSQILTMVGGGEFSVVNLITGLVIPVLYIIGATQMKTA